MRARATALLLVRAAAFQGGRLPDPSLEEFTDKLRAGASRCEWPTLHRLQVPFGITKDFKLCVLRPRNDCLLCAPVAITIDGLRTHISIV